MRLLTQRTSHPAADPSDPALRPSPIGGLGYREFPCVAQAERLRTEKEHWLVLTRSSVAGFNPIRDIDGSSCVARGGGFGG